MNTPESRYLILLIDDDALFARNTSEELQRAGYLTHHVQTGPAAIHLVVSGELNPDVIVLDIDLRDTRDGIDVARAILEHHRIPILFLSGYVDREATERVGDIDHVGFVTKEAGPHVLQQSIRTAIRLSNALSELHESEERFRSVVAESTEAVAMTDTEGHQIVWNRAAEELTGLPADEAMGTPLWEIMERLSPEEMDATRRHTFYDLSMGWLQGRIPVPSQGAVSIKIRHTDGTIRTVEQRIFPVPSRYGMRLGTVMRDVSRRVEAEEAVRELLTERTRLLRESHEQIGTDMQLVRSLLSVQRFRSADPVVQSVLSAAEQHIQLLARLYDQIYRSEEVDSVALPRLVSDILDEIPVGNDQILIATEVEPISVARQICVPIAFVLRELVLNSLQHAFPPSTAGTISVRLRKIDETWLELVVADSGKGIAPGTHTSDMHGFGLAMVTTFAEQFNGATRVEGAEGLRVRVTMQLPRV